MGRCRTARSYKKGVYVGLRLRTTTLRRVVRVPIRRCVQPIARLEKGVNAFVNTVHKINIRSCWSSVVSVAGAAPEYEVPPPFLACLREVAPVVRPA